MDSSIFSLPPFCSVASLAETLLEVGVPGRIFSGNWQQMWRKSLQIEELPAICGVEKELNPIFMGQCLVRFAIWWSKFWGAKELEFGSFGWILSSSYHLYKMKFDHEVRPPYKNFHRHWIDSTLKINHSGGLNRLASYATLEICGVNMAIGSSHRPSIEFLCCTFCIILPWNSSPIWIAGRLGRWILAMWSCFLLDTSLLLMPRICRQLSKRLLQAICRCCWLVGHRVSQ